MILESYEAQTTSSVRDVCNGDSSVVGLVAPFVFSAASQESLMAYLQKILDYLPESQDIDTPAVLHNLINRKTTLAHRIAFPGSTVTELSKSIDETVKSNGQGTQRCAGSPVASQPKLLAVFTGQGAQWAHMGHKLIQHVKMARATMEELDDVLRSLPREDRPSWALIETLSSADAERMALAEISQPLCTAVQIMVFDLLTTAGVRFSAAVGHSSGEICAAYAAGFISKGDALRIAFYRGRYAKLAQSPSGNGGAMLAVGTSLEDAESLCELEDFNGKLWVAAQNSQESITLSGDSDAIATAINILEEEKKFVRKLKVETAYHSPHMSPSAGPYSQSLRASAIVVQKPPIDAPIWISSVTGQRMKYAAIENKEGAEELHELSCDYWLENMLKPVLFYRALSASLQEVDDKVNFVVEIGPHPALKSPASETIKATYGHGLTYIGTLMRGQDDVKSLQACFGSLWTEFGDQVVSLKATEEISEMSFKAITSLRGLPTYAWLHDKQLWSESRSYRTHRTQTGAYHDLLGVLTSDSVSDQWRWRNVLNVKELRWLEGHALQGQTVFPATAYIALAMEASMQMAGSHSVDFVELCDLDIAKAIAISEHSATELFVTMTDVVRQEGAAGNEEILARFNAYSTTANSQAHTPANNCHGRIRVSLRAREGAVESALPPRSFVPVNMSDVDISQFYLTLRDEIGYCYEDLFQGLTVLHRKHGFSSGMIRCPKSSPGEKPYVFHPALADCALQGMFATVSAPGDGMIASIRVPKGFRRVTVIPSFCGLNMPDEVAFDCAMTDPHSDLMPGNVDIYTQDFAQKIIEFEGVTFAPFTPPTSLDDRCMFQESVWLPNGPDGDEIVRNRRPTTEQKQKALDAERAAFFYLKRAHTSVARTDRDNLPWYRQALLNYAEKVSEDVSNGNAPHAATWVTDTHKDIVEMMDS